MGTSMTTKTSLKKEENGGALKTIVVQTNREEKLDPRDIL